MLESLVFAPVFKPSLSVQFRRRALFSLQSGFAASSPCRVCLLRRRCFSKAADADSRAGTRALASSDGANAVKPMFPRIGGHRPTAASMSSAGVGRGKHAWARPRDLCARTHGRPSSCSNRQKERLSARPYGGSVVIWPVLTALCFFESWWQKEKIIYFLCKLRAASR